MVHETELLDKLLRQYGKVLYELCDLKAGNPDSVWEATPYAQYVQLRHQLSSLENDIVRFLRNMHSQQGIS